MRKKSSKKDLPVFGAFLLVDEAVRDVVASFVWRLLSEEKAKLIFIFIEEKDFNLAKLVTKLRNKGGSPIIFVLDGKRGIGHLSAQELASLLSSQYKGTKILILTKEKMQEICEADSSFKGEVNWKEF